MSGHFTILMIFGFRRILTGMANCSPLFSQTIDIEN